MQEEKHYRHECKYEITYADYYELRARLGCLMQRDAHVDADGKYRIHSLYFDNCDDIALREKVDGVAKREKFRIRYYGDTPTHLSLEKKQKVNGLCLKVSAPIERAFCEALMRGEVVPTDASAPPLVQELTFKMKSRLLRPRRVVSYTREPYVFAPGNVRVTFDMEIGGAPPADFFSPSPLPALRRDHMILEVKYDAFLPSVIADALQLGEIRVGAFSKYAACREYE